SGEASRRAPAASAAVLAVGTSHFWLGNAFRLQGNLNDALQHMRVYMTAADQLVVRDPHNSKFQIERAYGHNNVATILELQGNLRGALDENRAALDAKQLLLL